MKIEAPAYVFQMEQGRSAGTMPPIKAIKQWIKDKNANAGTDIPEEAAYAIAYVIKRDGIRVLTVITRAALLVHCLMTPRLSA